MAANDLSDKALAYNLFMLEFGKTQLKRGRVLSYDELRKQSLPLWNHISKQSRDDYKLQAIKKKNEILSEINNIHMLDARRAQKEREKFYAKNSLVKEHLQHKTAFSEDWKSEQFILADVNVFVVAKNDVFPAELALSKFSLNDGVVDSFLLHIELDTRILPSGLLCAAKMMSEDTHIPLTFQRSRDGSFVRIDQTDALKRLHEFLGTDKVVFVLKERNIKHDVFETVELTFMKLFKMTIFAAPLEELFKSLNGKMNEKIVDISLLTKNPYEHSSSIGCMHHYIVDAPMFCSLARVKRWAFQICKLMLPEDNLKQGLHKPHPKDKPEENQLIIDMSKMRTSESILNLSETNSVCFEHTLNDSEKKEIKSFTSDETSFQSSTDKSIQETSSEFNESATTNNTLTEQSTVIIDDVAQKEFVPVEEFDKLDLNDFNDDISSLIAEDGSIHGGDNSVFDISSTGFAKGEFMESSELPEFSYCGLDDF